MVAPRIEAIMKPPTKPIKAPVTLKLKKTRATCKTVVKTARIVEINALYSDLSNPTNAELEVVNTT